MKMNNHFYAGTLLIVFITILMVGCVKIPSEAPPLPDFKAEIRFFNAMGGQISVSVDGQNKASVPNGEASVYMEVVPGNRVFKLTDTDAETLFVDTDFFGTIFVKTKAGQYTKVFSKNRERWLYGQNTPEDSTARVTVAQMVQGDLTVSFENDDAHHDFGGAFGAIEKTLLPMGDYAVTVVAGADTVKTMTQTLANQSDQTIVFTGAANNPTVKTLNNE